MNIKFKVEDSIIHVHVKGEFSMFQAPLFSNEIEVALEASGATMVLLDASEIELIDSAAFGVIMSVYRKVKPQGGCVAFAAPKAGVMSTIYTLRLNELLPCYPSIEKAIETMQSTADPEVADERPARRA